MLTTDFLNATTREYFIPGLRNQVYEKTVLWNRLAAQGRVKPMTGRSLLWDIVAVKHASVGVYSGYAVLANQPVNPIKQGSLNPANYYATLAISGDEERRNTGNKERLLDMLKVQMDNADSTLRDKMSTDLYAANTTVGGDTVINGLGVILTQATGTYAGLNRATAGNEFWRANVDTTTYAYADVIDPTSAKYLPKVMRTNHLAATHDNAPDLIITTKAIYALYQDIAVVQNLRFNNEVANLGFGGVEFGPGVTMVFDTYQTAKYMDMLSLKAFQLFVYGDANFALKEPGWQIPTNQDAKVAHIIWSGQLRCDTPREQSRTTIIETS